MITFLKLIIAGLVTAILWYLLLDWLQEDTQLTDKVRRVAPGQFAELDYGRVHYQLRGPESAPLVVLIHGGGITGMEVWQKNINHLLKMGFRVLVFDLYGRGYSSRPCLEHTPGLYHDQLVELLAKLKISGPFHLIALSMGAIVALDYQQSHTKRVQKMVLIDPAVSGSYRANPLLRIPVLSDFLMTVYWYPEAVEKQRKEFVDQEQFEVYARRVRHFMAFEGYKHTNYSTWMYMLNQNKMELVANLKPANLLVIVGSEDPFFRQNQVDLFRRKLMGINIVQIEQSGHMPQYEQPDKVNQLIQAFLTE